MRRLPVCVLLLAALAGAQDKLRIVETFSPDFEIAQWRLRDINGDGSTELMLVGVNGEVRTWATNSTRLEKKPRGTLTLPDPRHTLLAFEDVLAEGGPRQLVALSPKGAVVYRAGEDAAFAAEATSLARRARFRLRTNEPRFADIMQDINRDGRLDLVVPGAETTDVWLNGGKGFRRAARIATDIQRREKMAAHALSDELTASFTVPRLATQDVNGDGRLDLLVRTGELRAFHMQREDGSIANTPDVSLDLGIFRDTTPRATLRPGRTLAGSDRTRYTSRDLDDDGIPDYVIAHRRKVWVFHGNRKQPQFVEPTSILKVNDDLTLLMVAHLDDDRFADLLLFRVQIPTLASLVVGLASDFDIEISAIGYRNKDGRRFERSPAWRSEIVVRVPPIVKLIKNPGKILARFESVGRKFRRDKRADLDGDGLKETLLMSEDGRRIEIYRGTKRSEAAKGRVNVDRTIRRVLFEDENRRWDFDRILGFLTDVAERRTKSLTGGKPPGRTFALRNPKKFEFLDYGTADLDGDGRHEILIRYSPRGDPTVSVFDRVR